MSPTETEARRAAAARLVGFLRRLEPLQRRLEEIDAETSAILATLRCEGVSDRNIKSLRRARALSSESMWQTAVTRTLGGSRPPAVRGTIYFLQCEATGLVKIGFSEKARARLRSIRRQSSTSIKTLLLVDAGEAEEAELHRRFSADRHHNEWFRMTPALAAEIERLRSLGKIDPGPLLSWRVCGPSAPTADCRPPQ